jgi:hypothetical protein
MAGQPKLSARKVLASKVELVYGVDTADTGNGILASNFTCAPMAASVAKRQRAYQTFGADPSEVTQIYRTIAFDVEMAGSGVIGSAPPLYGNLLRGCGLSETLATSGIHTGVFYQPISSAFESVSHHFFWDSLEHKLLGSRGTLSLKASGGALPMMNFSYSGLYSPVTDADPPDVHTDLEAFLDTEEVNLANTQFSLLGVEVVMESFQLDAGNTVIFRDRPNAAEVAITDRIAKGTVSFEALDIATCDFFTAAADKTTGALQLIQGTAGGNIVQIDAPRVRTLNPTWADQNGILVMNVGLEFCRTDGDDEFSIWVK